MIIKTSAAISKKLIREASDARRNPGIVFGFAHYGEPWPVLNRITGGIKKNIYAILAGRPKDGKSMIMLAWVPWIAMQAQSVGMVVRLVVLETTRAATMRRMASILAGIEDPTNVLRGMTTEEELNRYIDAVNWLATLPIEIMTAEDDPRQEQQSENSEIMYRDIERFLAKQDTFWWCVDHIGLVGMPGYGYSDMTARITAASVAFARFSHRVVGGLVITHTNRESGKSGSPNISDLANADQLTKDGDEFFVLDRPFKRARNLTPDDIAYMDQIGGNNASLRYVSRDYGEHFDYMIWSKKRACFVELKEQPDTYQMPRPGDVPAQAQPRQREEDEDTEEGELTRMSEIIVARAGGRVE